MSQRADKNYEQINLFTVETRGNVPYEHKVHILFFVPATQLDSSSGGILLMLFSLSSRTH